MKTEFLVLAASLLSVATAKPTVYLIRHGEKPDDGGNGLSAAGMQRAQCVKNVFSSSSQYKIGKIIAQTPNSDGSRARPYQTVKPLADSLGLTVDTSCDRDDPKCVRNLVRDFDDDDDDEDSGKGNVLICWEHKALSDIIEKLGDSNPPDYPSDRFDIIWTDPPNYTDITNESSENCPGLDN